MTVVGELLLGRYRIERFLGEGGMSRVLAATDLQTETAVALKLIATDRAADREAIARMLREAEATTLLTGRHTGKVLDVGQTEAGDPVLVMELLDGEDLGQLLARRGRIPQTEAIAMVLEACEGLAEAHARRLVHRDIKPSNLFLARDLDGSMLVKVIDFGVVKIDVPKGETLTKTTSMIGSVAYMAPEQLRGLAIDARADVWSLGVVLYELIAGRRPFPAATITDASIRIAVEPPEPLPDDIDHALAEVIARCLEKDPTNRYGDVAELAEALAGSDDAIERAARIRRVLGARRAKDKAAPGALERSPTRARSSTGAPDLEHGLALPLWIRGRDLLPAYWLPMSLGVFLWSLGLLLGSFAVDDRLNDLTIGDKPTGYLSSFNWTLVHTFICPITIAIIAALIRATNAAVSNLGSIAKAAWDRRARNVVITGALMCLVLALGYTVVEWSFVMTGRCDRGTFLGWPNQLCELGGAANHAFMAFAAIAQTVMVACGWVLLSLVIWTCDLFFGTRRIELPSSAHPHVAALFGIAMWGWAAIFVGLYLARLWSVHLRVPDTNVIETIFTGSLFAVDARTQPDWGSMIGGVVIVAAATLPFVLLRLRVPEAAPHVRPIQRVAVAIGVVGLTSMIFPRLGFFLLPGFALVGLSVGPVRRALAATWSRRAP